ncbi:MAG: murein L,D-transpeptidase catalytic domain family protein [Legionella sp.]|nr:murein L,D-transpeptidase catalytic domain family protein [Legionella sp.]
MTSNFLTLTSTNTNTETNTNTSPHTSTPPSLPKVAAKTHAFCSSDIKSQLKHLCNQAPKLNPRVLKLALTAYKNATKQGSVKKQVLTVIDYSMASNKQRMWVFDIKKEQLLYNTFVAHGRNSGMNTASHFSNRESSKQSSLGTYITKNTYMGHKGYSLNLKGLDKGFNDNAYNRRVVVHGAWYMEPSFIRKAGRAGLSWGCPAIAQTIAKPVINTIKNGSVVFAYFPDKYFLSHSGLLVA